MDILPQRPAEEQALTEEVAACHTSEAQHLVPEPTDASIKGYWENKTMTRHNAVV